MLIFKFLFKNFHLFFTNKNYRNFIVLMATVGHQERFVHKKIKILKHKIHIIDSLSFIWQYYEIFYKQFYYFDTNKRNPFIIDCGANVGTSCIYYKTIYPDCKIIAYEADSSIAKVAQENVNNLKLSDTTIIPHAIWINNGTINLSTDGADGASLKGVDNIVTVPCTRLKDVLEQYTRVDFLKMDIEGAEYEVLLDCKNSLINVHRIFIEYHSFSNEPQVLQQVLGILTTNGFRYSISSNKIVDKPLEQIIAKGPNMDLQLNIFAVNTSLK